VAKASKYIDASQVHLLVLLLLLLWGCLLICSWCGCEVLQSVSVCVCLFVCPLTYLKNHTSKFYHIFCICYGHGSELLWQHSVVCHVLPVFLDDVMFSLNGANGPESKSSQKGCLLQYLSHHTVTPKKQINCTKTGCIMCVFVHIWDCSCVLLMYVVNYSTVVYCWRKQAWNWP